MEHSVQGREIRIAGRLTFADAGTFRAILDGIKKGGAGGWVIDLSRLEFIDSSGMGMLLMARDAANDAGGSVNLRGAGGQVGKVLEMARFNDLFGSIA